MDKLTEKHQISGKNKFQQTKTLFVINPVSGDVNKDEIVREIEQYASDHDQYAEFYFTRGKDDKENISKLIHEHPVNKVVAVGGDGTCNMTAQVLLDTDIALGIIPRGSANGLATELELPDDIQGHLNIIYSDKTIKLDVLKFDSGHISLHLSDLGFNAHVVERFEKGDTRGFLGYAKHFFDAFGKAKPAKFKLEFDHKTKKKRAYMLVLANATKYGTGAVINPDGKPDDGIFEIIVVRPNDFMQFLKMIIPFFIRRIHTLNVVDIYSCKQVQIKNYSRQTLQIDGEIVGKPEQVNVEILPQSINVLVP